MKIVDLNKYYNIYIDAATLREKAIREGKSKLANKQYTIIKNIFIKAENNVESAKYFYKRLRNNEKPEVSTWACAHSLALGIDIAESEKILDDISKMKNIGIVRLSAEMTLKVWKEQGYLKF